MILLAAVLPAVMAQTPEDSLKVVNADWGWQQLEKGAQAGYAELQIFGGATECISVVKYPQKRFKTSIIHAPAETSASTSKIAIANKALIACNGSYFNMRKITPVTFVALKHQQLGWPSKSELFRLTGSLCIKGRRVDIVPSDSTKYESMLKKYDAVLESGPILRVGGKDVQNTKEGGFFASRHPRTIIGKGADGYIYMIVIDGRWKEHSAGASIEETTAIARYFGLVDALNLDGGGSSTVWSAQTGTINHPNDNGKWDHEGERTVPNVVIAK